MRGLTSFWPLFFLLAGCSSVGQYTSSYVADCHGGKAETRAHLAQVAGDVAAHFGQPAETTFTEPLMMRLTIEGEKYRYEYVYFREEGRNIGVAVVKDGDGVDALMREISGVLEASMTQHGCRPWTQDYQRGATLPW